MTGKYKNIIQLCANDHKNAGISSQEKKIAQICGEPFKAITAEIKEMVFNQKSY